MCIYLVGPKEVSPEENQPPWEEFSLRVGNTLWGRSIGGGVGGMFSLLCAGPTLVPVSGYRIARSTSIGREGCSLSRKAGKGLRLGPDSAVPLTHSWCHVSFPHPYSPSCTESGRGPHPHGVRETPGNAESSLQVRGHHQQRAPGLSVHRGTP